MCGMVEAEGDLARANALMLEALRLLDANRHAAAAHLDLAICRLGVRPADELPD